MTDHASDPVVQTTLGMLIVDTFEFKGPRPAAAPSQAIGGAGVYATLKEVERLEPEQVGLIADKGSDFPAYAAAHLDTYGPIAVYREDLTRETTRSLNIIQGEHRDFAYLNARKRLDVEDFKPTRLWKAKFLHAACSPDRLLETVRKLVEAEWPAQICYEPIPYSCLPANVGHLQAVLPCVDIFSPNHSEAIAFFEHLVVETEEDAIDKEQIEGLITRFFDMGAKNIVVIRCSSAGCCGNSRERHQRGQNSIWLPAYHTKSDRVVDATGGGNAFLGGFIAGLELTNGDLHEAMRYGSVSASFVIEQFGLPAFTEPDLWNGKTAMSRLAEMRR